MSDRVRPNAAVAGRTAAKNRRHEPPRYVHKADYGKVPEYLEYVKREIEEEKEVISRMVEDELGRPAEKACEQPLPSDERESLLAALKAKWEATNREYQLMTHTTLLDTVGKLRRKESLEMKLDQLQKDIELLSSKRPIAVTDDAR